MSMESEGQMVVGAVRVVLIAGATVTGSRTEYKQPAVVVTSKSIHPLAIPMVTSVEVPVPVELVVLDPSL